MKQKLTEGTVNSDHRSNRCLGVQPLRFHFRGTLAVAVDPVQVGSKDES